MQARTFPSYRPLNHFKPFTAAPAAETIPPRESPDAIQCTLIQSNREVTSRQSTANEVFMGKSPGGAALLFSAVSLSISIGYILITSS